jgi:hypothetical protein
VTCLYFAASFVDFKTGELQGGRYATPKFVFFIVLCVSALLDIPLFLGCIVQGGPTDCEWNSASYVVFWLFHLLATCGYVYAIITPPILWSDIIQHKDGNLWNSAYPVDSTKLFFRVIFLLFCANELTTVIGSTMYQDPNNQAEYTKSNAVGAFSDCFTPVITTTVTVGCLWSGIALQRHVVSVGLGGSAQFRILVQLNITMLIIAVTYIMRSLLVLTLFDDMPQEYVDLFHPMRSSFFLWLLWTRWLPCVFCSFCLVHEMRFKGSGNQPLSATGSGGAHPELLKGERTSSLFTQPRTSNMRAVSADSGRSNDSALEETYSMLSSVDFPDSGSDASSCVLSPFGSPERSSLPRDEGSPDLEQSNRRSRKRLIQQKLQQQSSGPLPGRAGARPGQRTAQQRMDSTSGSDTEFKFGDYNGTYSPPRTSIDHFFTFNAPNLTSANLSGIAAADSSSSSLNTTTVTTAAGGRSASIPIHAALANSLLLPAVSAPYVGSAGTRAVTSFSPPSWRGPIGDEPAFINADERTSPEVNSKAL